MGNLDISLLAIITKRLSDKLTELSDVMMNNVAVTIELKKIIRHRHAAHLHNCCHSFNGDIGTKDYKDPYFIKCEQSCFETKYYPDSFSTAVYALMREYSQEVDYDNNGQIFGQDFLFLKTDKSVPIMIRNLQRIHLKNNLIPHYSWNQYLATLSPYLFR